MTTSRTYRSWGISSWSRLNATVLLLQPVLANADTSANFPPLCAPLGSFNCSSLQGTEWSYTHSACPTAGPFATEGGAANNLFAVYFRPNNCSTTVTPAGSWLSGGPHSVAWCTTYFNNMYLPVVGSSTNIELQNFRPYSVSVVATVPACTTTQNETQHVSMSRDQVCPLPGMVIDYYGNNVVNGVTYSAAYCRGPNELKDLGVKSCPIGKSCGIGNPINAGTGNKYQVERDYTGAGAHPLKLERFYNSAGKLYSQTSYFGPQWFTRIGRHWRHTYDRSINLLTTATLTTAFVHRADGKIHIYNLYNDQYHTDADVKSRLLRLKDGGGIPIGWEFRNAEDDSVETYNNDGRLTSIANRAGVTQSLGYDAGGRLISVTDAFGRQLTFNYDSANRIETLTVPGGGQYVYAYSASGNLASVTYPDTRVRTYVYNEPANTTNTNIPHALTGIIDENAQRFATYKYDDLGRAISTEHANGAEQLTLVYDWMGTPTVTDALGTARTYSQQTILGVKKTTGITQPAASGSGTKTATAAYDSNGNPASQTDFNGNQTTYAYDLSRNLETSRTEAYGTAKARTITTAWHSTFRLPTQIDEPNRRTSFTHDANGSVLTRTVTDLSVTPNISRTWTYTYNSFGQVLTENGPRTDVTDTTTYTYYGTSATCTATVSGASTTGCRGQLNTVTNALSHVTTFGEYNAHGQALKVTDPNGLVTTLTHDARQRLTSKSAGGETTTLEYWPTGLLKKVTLPDASFLLYTYDNAHRLTRIDDSEGNHLVYTLDAMGNRTKEESFDPSSYLVRLHHRAFNTLNQLWKEIGAANTAAVTTTFGFDDNGNQTSANAPLGRNSSSLYDELNRLKQLTDPASGVTLFGYDPQDNLTSVTDARGKVTSYQYSGFGELIEQTSPDTGVTGNTYDEAGNLKTSTDARSKTGTRSYDALNRLTQLAYPDQTISYSFDTGSNNQGRLMQVTDGSGSTSWTYTSLGRVASRTQVMGSVSKTLGYGYNSEGQLATLTTPAGQTISYAYTHNRIASVTVNSTVVANNVLYDPFGPVRQWSWGNATLAVRTFDQDGNVDQIDSAGLKTYAQDDAFRITGVTDAVNSSLSWSLGYDALDRLTSASKTGQSQSWTYDANGNRLTQGGSSSSTSTISSTSNRLASISGALSRSYGYDAAGNTTSFSGFTFGYNDEGRMTSFSGSATASYAHNALGQRVKKTVSGVSTYFVYDEAGHLIGEYDGSGNLIQETVWLEEIPIATLRPNGGSVSIFYVHTDHLNTPRRISRPSDNVIVWRWDSDPFGTDAANQDPDGDATTFVYHLRFPGQYFDAETGLSYNYERDYEPMAGRYIESDPIGLFAGVNTYGYVSQNPLSWIDPMGLVEGSPTNLAKRRAIDRIGRSYAASTAWAFAEKKDDFGPNTNKCNKFVFDVLKEAGAPAYYTPRGAGPRPPMAADWANRYAKIPNWRPLGPKERPMPGDVAAFPLPGHSTYSGHSGLITSCECEAGFSNISAHDQMVFTILDQFTWEPGLLYRRYTGD